MSGSADKAGRAGTSLVETVVALLLTAFLVPLAWWVLGSARRSAEEIMVRGEALETGRLAWHVLAREVGAGVPERDWRVEGAGVLPLRAFRGVAEVCAGPSEPGSAVVRYRGLRLPEPAKDSLLVLTSAGDWVAVKLDSRGHAGSATCQGSGDGTLERWLWHPDPGDAVLARLYESGSYHLEDRAVRYRVGAGGRQPLTAERLLHPGSAFMRHPEGLGVRLRMDVGRAGVWERGGLLRMDGADGG